MIELTGRIERGEADKTLTLPFERRLHSRLRVTLDDGTEAGVFLARGQSLRDGDLLTSADGVVVRIRAADEPVSEVRSLEPALFARACYHLGNRHVPLQIGDGVLRFLRDHVLDQMLRGLGLNPEHVVAPFEPEPGAYGGHAHGGHPHEHAH